MGILLELALALVLIGVVVSYSMRGRVGSEREAVTERRVAAYMETIRREGKNPELSAMSDSELKDLLLSSARNLKLQRDRKTYLLAAGVVVALIASIMVGTQDGAQGFGIAILVGAMVLYGLNEFLGRQMVAPLVSKGIDIERLRVE